MSLWPVITAIRKFLHLNDTPASYSGQGGKYVKVAAAEDSLEFTAIVQAFLGLTDTPASYSGQGEKIVRVKVAEDGLEFTEVALGLWVSSNGEIYPSPSKHVRVADDKDIKFASGAKIERVAGHLVLTPEANKLVKVAVLRQDDTSNSYKNNSIILTGWGEDSPGAGYGFSYQADDVSFGITFAAPPILVIGANGNQGAAGAGTPASLWATPGFVAAAPQVNTTSFRAYTQSIDLSNLKDKSYVYSWIAIGELA